MNLATTITTERGKPVLKTGNDYISIELTVHKQKMFNIEFNGEIMVIKKTNKTLETIWIFENNNFQRLIPCKGVHKIKNTDGLCLICGYRE
jgi:hypothetical protein